MTQSCISITNMRSSFQTCCPRDQGLGLECPRVRFYEVLVLLLPVKVLSVKVLILPSRVSIFILVSTSWSRSRQDQNQDHAVIKVSFIMISDLCAIIGSLFITSSQSQSDIAHQLHVIITHTSSSNQPKLFLCV